MKRFPFFMSCPNPQYIDIYKKANLPIPIDIIFNRLRYACCDHLFPFANTYASASGPDWPSVI